MSLTNGYPWPASQLGPDEMRVLYNLRTVSGIPITKVLKALILSSGKDGQATEKIVRASEYIKKRLELLNQEYKLDKENWYDVYPTIGKIKELLAIRKILER